MTRDERHWVRCHECGFIVRCRNSHCDNHDGRISLFTPHSRWLRELPYPLDSTRISNQNLDAIWHNYRDDWLITIEEKCHRGKQRRAQRDTHGIVSQMLTIASGSMVETMRGKKPIEYRGYYLVRFSHTQPDDSEWIEINGMRCSKEQYLSLLRDGVLLA